MILWISWEMILQKKKYVWYVLSSSPKWQINPRAAIKKEKNIACKYTEWNKNRIFARNKF